MKLTAKQIVHEPYLALERIELLEKTLGKIKFAIQEAPIELLTDTLWVEECCTAVDLIDLVLEDPDD